LAPSPRDREALRVQLIAWFALMAPAKTPRRSCRAHDAAVKGIAKPEVKEKFAAIGIDVAPLNRRARPVHPERDRAVAAWSSSPGFNPNRWVPRRRAVLDLTTVVMGPFATRSATSGRLIRSSRPRRRDPNAWPFRNAVVDDLPQHQPQQALIVLT